MGARGNHPSPGRFSSYYPIFIHIHDYGRKWGNAGSLVGSVLMCFVRMVFGTVSPGEMDSQIVSNEARLTAHQRCSSFSTAGVVAVLVVETR
jgi:hypothetical protein